MKMWTVWEEFLFLCMFDLHLIVLFCYINQLEASTETDVDNSTIHPCLTIQVSVQSYHAETSVLSHWWLANIVSGT